ncbi:hypothetical protein [Promicromonospora soli]|uniref:Peptidase inhibitor family I36 n=1 Tax=Promicromonospora soli TaxID=2035533 RepID=A0A919KXI6_9MICO|nr:hypothetical protein [Promicromonospora soli]GHH76467.1 hypothetical protein GCM10017772_35200 [Promicromonospora soli]
MRKISVLLATLGLVATGALFPMSVQASTACDNAWDAAKSGYFFAYDATNCGRTLGADVGNDVDWNDRTGAFQQGDGDKAESLLHKGTSGLAVQVFDHAHFGGNWSCIKKSEYYVSNLLDDRLEAGPGGAPAANTISSHRWVNAKDCGVYFLH